MSRNFHLTQIGADNLGVGLFQYALPPEDKFLATNSTLYHMLGYKSKKELLEEKIETLFFYLKDSDIFFDLLKKNGSVKFFEVPLRKRNGELTWTAITASWVFSQNNTKCLEGIIQDISAQKEFTDRLVMEKDFLQALFDNIPDAVYFKDKNNRIIKVNKFYIEGTGLKEEQIVGKTDFDFFPHEQAKAMFEDDTMVLETGKAIVGKIEKTLLSSGVWNQVITTKIPMYDRKGKIIGTMGTTRDMSTYANLEKERLDMLVTALEVLGKALEMRDPYTFSHMRHVAAISEKIGRRLGWNGDRLLGLKLAGELHDLGKISIPLDILNKSGPLTSLERQMLREHVENCYSLIKDVKFPFPLAEIVYQHHERLDGSGYPRQLHAEDILPEARILCVSDVLEAMTQRRPYREGLGIEKACQELIGGKGVKYDPEIVDVTLSVVKANGGKPFWNNS